VSRASELILLLAERARAHIQHVAVQRCILILFSLLDVLVTIPDLVLLCVFSSLVTVRLGLSQQVVCGNNSSHHDGEGRWGRRKLGS
jgi:hypothetical protein